MKKIMVVFIAAIFGLLMFHLATWNTQRHYVEDLQRQIPDAAAFIETNKEAFDILLSVKERLDSYNDEKGEMVFIYDYSLVYKETGIEIHAKYELSRRSHDRTGEWVKEGGELDFLSKNDRQILLETFKGRRSTVIFPDGISANYADSGGASLSIEHPAHETEEEISRNYSYYWHSVRINDIWCATIINLPKN